VCTSRESIRAGRTAPQALPSVRRNREQGSGGSSAGPASAAAAGLVAVAVGTETGGSIMDPASRCGVVGLRPTCGRISRHGVMPLRWTMDNVGPICRTVEDCAMVFDILRGPGVRQHAEVPDVLVGSTA